MKPFLGSLVLSVLVHAWLVWLLSLGLARPVFSPLPSLESIAIELSSPEPEPPPLPPPKPPAAQTPVLPMGASQEEPQPETSPEPDDTQVAPEDSLADATEPSDATPVESAGQGLGVQSPAFPSRGF